MGWRRDHFRCCGELEGDVQLCVTSRERLQSKTCLSALLPKICHMGELVVGKSISSGGPRSLRGHGMDFLRLSQLSRVVSPQGHSAIEIRDHIYSQKSSKIFLGHIGPDRDQVLKSGLECKHWFDARGYEAPPAGLAPPAGPFPPCWVQGPAAGGVEYLSKGSHNLSFHWGHDPLAFGLPCVVQRFYSL